MARAYTAAAPAYSLAAVSTDIHYNATSASVVIEVDELDLNQATATTVANVSMTVKRFSSTFTAAAGGTSVTPRPHLTGDAATGVTATYNNTTLTSAGTSVTLYADAINIINGWQKLPAPEDRWSYTISQAMVWNLGGTPTAGTYSSSTTYRETV